MDIDAGADVVERIRPLAESTRRTGTIGELGGFGGPFDLRAAGYLDPILVAAADGVGTKLEVAIETGRHSTVGIDLVAMCANDLVVQGAEPLFFLDYFATGKLDSAAAEGVISGIAEGCRMAGCALIGGETAEMPGMYEAEKYDLAGFAVGAVERGSLLPRGDMRKGDVVLGLASDGAHSNGFSLIRHVLEQRRIAYDAPFSGDRTWADELLTPTRIYTKACLRLHAEGLVKGFAHITGGGLSENVPRMLPDGLAAVLDPEAWPLPPVFVRMMRDGGVSAAEMARTFNCGIGMAAIVSPDKTDAALDLLRAEGEEAYRIGELRTFRGGDRLSLAGTAWNV